MAFLKGSKIEGNLYVEGDIRASQALSYTSTDNGDETKEGFGFPRYENPLEDNLAKFSVVSGVHDGKFTSAILNENASTYKEDPVRNVNKMIISFTDVVIRNSPSILFRNGTINIANSVVTDSDIHFFYKMNDGTFKEQNLSNIGTEAVLNPHNAYGFYYENPSL